MLYKALSAEPLQIENDRDVSGIASVFGNVDLGSDRVYPGAFTKTIMERGTRLIKHLWNHQADQMPTAVILELKEIGRDDLPQLIRQLYPTATGGLLNKRRYLDTPRGNEALYGIKAGAIVTQSFGYDAIRSDFEKTATDQQRIRNLKELRLWETSDVNFPMNEATAAAKSGLFWNLLTAVDSGQDLADLLQAGSELSPTDLDQIAQSLDKLAAVIVAAATADQGEDDQDGQGGYNPFMMMSQPMKRIAVIGRMAAKGVLPYKETPKAAEDAPWDAGKEVGAANVDDLKAMCAWVDSANSDNKGAYKLPHHLAAGDHSVVWDGVKAAMGALLGSRGGVDIPEADRKGVYDHLAKHYKQFEKDVPDFKFVNLAFIVQHARTWSMMDELKQGRVLSQANLDQLKHAIDVLQQILSAAEPPPKALTDREISLRMRVKLLALESDPDGNSSLTSAVAG